MGQLNRCGGGAVDDYDSKKFSNDDNVFQLLDHAYDLLQDGENPMKVVRMAMFIAILEMHHLEYTPQQMKKVFEVMADKFLKNFLCINTQVDYGEE